MCFCPVSTLGEYGIQSITNLEFPSFLELLIIALALDIGIRSEHNILVSIVNIFLPHSEPGAFLVMFDLFPLVTLRRSWNFGFFADINRDLLRLDPLRWKAC